MDEATDTEKQLRDTWTRLGVKPERQEQMFAEIFQKAQPGAKVGPFTIPAMIALPDRSNDAKN